MLFTCAIIFAVLSLPFYFAYHHHHHHHHNNPPIDPIKSRQIIIGKQLPSQSHQKSESRLTPLQSRAIPNQRVRIVFGVDNAFTSHDENHVRRFIAKARGLINLDPADWYALAEMTRIAARGSIERAIDASASSSIAHTRIPVVNLIQTVTLRVISRVLFTMEDEEVLNLQDKHLLNLANAINDTWISSKTTSTTPTPRFEDNNHLQDSLTSIFPNIDLTRENPLNLLLPGFETMWRVILRAFLETGYTPAGTGHPEWRGILAAFARKPTRGQFTLLHNNEDSSSGGGGGDGGVSVEMLVNETLRLYPPTRRVYRAFQFAEPEPELQSSSPCMSRSGSRPKSTTITSADIETIQTAPCIWGPEASVFNPTRWRCGLATTQEKKAFFPFGSAPFVCPAQKVFGPRVIGLVLGALFLELGVGVDGSSGWVLGSGCDDSDGGGGDLEGLRSGMRLSNERDAYRELYLVRGGDVKKPE